MFNLVNVGDIIRINSDDDKLNIYNGLFAEVREVYETYILAWIRVPGPSTIEVKLKKVDYGVFGTTNIVEQPIYFAVSDNTNQELLYGGRNFLNALVKLIDRLKPMDYGRLIGLNVDIDNDELYASIIPEGYEDALGYRVGLDIERKATDEPSIVPEMAYRCPICTKILRDIGTEIIDEDDICDCDSFCLDCGCGTEMEYSRYFTVGNYYEMEVKVNIFICPRCRNVSEITVWESGNSSVRSKIKFKKD